MLRTLPSPRAAPAAAAPAPPRLARRGGRGQRSRWPASSPSPPPPGAARHGHRGRERPADLPADLPRPERRHRLRPGRGRQRALRRDRLGARPRQTTTSGAPSATTAACGTSPALGVYVDADPGVAARALEVDTPPRGDGGGLRRDRRRGPRTTRPDERPAHPSCPAATGRDRPPRRQGERQLPRALRARHRRPALPLLPAVDHRACPTRATTPGQVRVSEIFLFR